MQAIARVNRVFKDKEGGLIVDYVGIASALKTAMKEYTKRDQSKYGDMNIAKIAYPKFQEKLQVCKDLLHGYNFSAFIGGTPLVMAKLITGGVNFVLDAKAPERKRFIPERSFAFETVTHALFKYDNRTRTAVRLLIWRLSDLP